MLSTANYTAPAAQGWLVWGQGQGYRDQSYLVAEVSSKRLDRELDGALISPPTYTHPQHLFLIQEVKNIKR